MVDGLSLDLRPVARSSNPGTDYIRIHLARPVPRDGGQARLRIVKTYKDPKSYYSEGSTIVFKRGLGIRRNSIVLPPGNAEREGEGVNRQSGVMDVMGQSDTAEEDCHPASRLEGHSVPHP